MTEPVKLHVGYIGKTRKGKRAEVTEHVPAKKGRDYFILSNGKCVWPDGSLDHRFESKNDIIGPWVEPEPKLECWVNVYPDGGLSHAFDSQSEADGFAGKERIRCVRMIEADEQE